MQCLKLIKKYVVDWQIYVALMGTALAAFFMTEQNVFRFPTLLLVFLTYFSGYLYTKYQHHRHFYKILIVNAACGIFAMVLIFLNHNEIRIFKWLVIVVLGLLYNSFFLEKFIRKIPLLKVFYVGFTWALINAWLIVPQFHLSIFLITILFVTALILPFDIRDVNEDHIVTFPRLIGVQHTKYLAYVLLFASLMIAVSYLRFPYSICYFITCGTTFVLIYFSENSNPDFYFSFWVESMSGLPMILYGIVCLASS